MRKPDIILSNRSRKPARPVRRRLGEGGNPSRAFTIVEVMVAAMILVVGFMGMIQAITIGSEMMATARRQTIANQIITHEIEKLRLTSWAGLPSSGTAAATYNSDSSDIDDAIAGSGVNFVLATSVATITTDLKEVTFTVQWTKSGTTTAATTPTGSWLNQLAFYRPSPIARTYTRVGVGYFGRYGLSLSTQRS